MAIAITHLGNHIIRTGTFPNVFKCSQILPLGKQGKPHKDLNLYRPINNLNTIDKVLKKVIRIQVEEHLQKYKIIPNNHHGGRTSVSNVTAVQEIEAI